MTESTFVDACRRKQVDHTPVWFMRQAGRYLPSYRKLRTTKGILEIAKDPELASDVTVDPVRRLGVDAAVMFADIMLPLEGVGVKFRIEENLGPVIQNPIRTMKDVEALSEFDPDRHVDNVLGTIRLAVKKLRGTPLVGFSGAPFTLASYLVEGSPTRDFQKTKSLMYTEPDVWRSLMSRLTRLVIVYLRAQVRDGVSAAQLFDSWVGCLSPEDYRTFAMPYTKEIFGALGRKVPTIHFCANSGTLVEDFARTGPDVLSVDWRVPIGTVWERTAGTKGVQGNLDPAAAAAGGKVMEKGANRILEEAAGRRGHVFNLGHGVLRETPPENLRRLVQLVHGATSKRR
ncbi:MAG: uroporphyrinogen decarboxylase [Thaumarchaeota archaeon]|nr:uroporphyrinogen decarboxylase [Nitrososphaerota archaeon]